MKKVFFIFFILCLGVVKAQDISLVYKSQIEIPEEGKIKVLGEHYTQLDYSGGKEIYFPIEKPENSEKEIKFQYVQGVRLADKIIHQASYRVIYKDRSENKKVTMIHRRDKDFLLEEELKELDWIIKEETKKIDKYTCKLAEAQFMGRTVSAWFTEEIPISSGPETFGGLPGLILEYKFVKKHVFIESISFKPKFDVIEPPKNGEKMTREEYEQYFKKKS